MQVSVKHDLKRLKRDLNRMERSVLPQALARTLNRVATSARKVALQNIAPLYKANQKEVRQHIHISKAGRRKYWVTITATGRRKQLIHFVVGSKANTQQPGGKRAPVRIKTFGKTRTLAKGFVTHTKAGSGNKSVYKRKTGGRYPLQMMYGPSVPVLFKLKSTQRLMRDKIAERFPIEFRANLAFYVERRRRR
jgi:hypothetical protein